MGLSEEGKKILRHEKDSILHPDTHKIEIDKEKSKKYHKHIPKLGDRLALRSFDNFAQAVDDKPEKGIFHRHYFVTDDTWIIEFSCEDWQQGKA